MSADFECHCDDGHGWDPGVWWLMERLMEVGPDLRRLGRDPNTGERRGLFGLLDANMRHLIAHHLLAAGVGVPANPQEATDPWAKDPTSPYVDPVEDP